MKKLLLLLFILWSTALFPLEIVKVDPLDFGSISGSKKRISPSKGARVIVKGIPGKTVEAEIDDNIVLNGNRVKFKIEDVDFEKSEIVLDSVGKGTFRVGGTMSIIENKGVSDISERIWIKLEYKE